MKHISVFSPSTDNPTTRADGSWGNRQVVGEVPGAELHECTPLHNAVSKKSDESCSSEESRERSKQDTKEFDGVLSTGIQSHNPVQAPIFRQSGTGQTVHGSGNHMSNNGVRVGRVIPQTSSSNSTSHAHTSSSNITSHGTDDTTTNRPSQHRHDDITGAQLEPDNSNNDQNVSADTIIFDDSDSKHPGIDIDYAGLSSSKHNTSSNS